MAEPEPIPEMSEQEQILKLAELVENLAQQTVRQREIIRGLVVLIDSAYALNRIHHDRLTSLENRARGMSFEDMVDGKDPGELGHTNAHAELLSEIEGRIRGVLTMMEQEGDAQAKRPDQVS